MGEITIKVADEALVRRLTELAHTHQISPEAEATAILRRATGVPLDRESRLATARRIAALTPHRRQTDATEMLREDRSR
ncbi:MULTISPECIES: hypothetical protein [Martelella]|uniref:Uncharacterized protein n=1 Tax=Martelella mediterranea DSM 17316 TaxID=1122214 RepID=A0A1U9Z166_9HYPH|nr:hypothetical protein [Martelella mediterranea]AQZ51424.1 hypothetical protein Mame_02086 [Martelella mediterranea DSM 17316]